MTPASVAPAAGVRARHLPGPSLDGWRPRLTVSLYDEVPTDARLSESLLVTSFEVPIFSRPGTRWPIGHARIGSRLPARPSSHGRCSGGHWYEVSGGGFVCTGDGAEVERGEADEPILSRADLARRLRLDAPVPFRYAKASAGAPRLKRLPSPEQARAMSDGEVDARLVERTMKGAYLLALARRVEVAGEEFFETIAGHFVRAADLEPKPTPPMHGERLDRGTALPLAFAFVPAELYCLEDAAWAPCGEVEQHARFTVDGVTEHDGIELVRVSPRKAVPRAAVRVVERIEPPKGLPAGSRWMHIDLTEQFLVAYEDADPVYATLVSTGRRGFDTLPGLFQVDRKYLTKTMRGRDEDGPYEVQEVPWTMYYDGNYAVHGAYWHDRFGRTRSHGCVNVPPVDARWLYLWTEPALPFGWHSMYSRLGAHIYITGETPPDDPPDGDGAGDGAKSES